MQTVVETAYFLKRAAKRMTDAERLELVSVVASNPEIGVLLKETGGLRKVRFATGIRGKSGGVRVVYYFFSEHAPVFLLEVFAKSEKDNLSKADRNDMAQLAGLIAATYGSRR